MGGAWPDGPRQGKIGAGPSGIDSQDAVHAVLSGVDPTRKGIRYSRAIYAKDLGAAACNIN
jgi:hypothetical protein